jgi:hypothetical protein
MKKCPDLDPQHYRNTKKQLLCTGTVSYVYSACFFLYVTETLYTSFEKILEITASNTGSLLQLTIVPVVY